MEKKLFKSILKQQKLKIKAIKIFVELSKKNDGIYISSRKNIDSIIRNQTEINNILMDTNNQKKIRLIENFKKVKDSWDYLKIQNDTIVVVE